MAEPVQATVVWDEALTHYDFGPSHPMTPIRLDLTARLCREIGLFDLPQLQVVTAQPAVDEFLATVHEPAYIAAVRAAALDPTSADPLRGLGTDDDPAFIGMHDASARIVGASLAAVQAMWRGETAHGVNFSGGLHHAMSDRAGGFCIYNDVAVAIRWLLANGAQRVAYVDIDVHHGDGVQDIFWDDPRVLTISVHESGRALFPGTGFPAETGGPGAEGLAANVALPPGTGDAQWLRAIHAVVPPLVRAFQPDVLVTQHGCDTHALDPLAHLQMSVDAQRAAAQALHELAHEVAGGRWLALGGGGYAVVEVVPRTWTHLVAIAAHAPIDPAAAVPERWREYVQERFGRPGPAVMGDLRRPPEEPAGGPALPDPPDPPDLPGRPTLPTLPKWRSWTSGVDPQDPVDQAVLATRQAVFPLHGLDVWFD
jgi:acetoin utilization protein AcuC